MAPLMASLMPSCLPQVIPTFAYPSLTLLTLRLLCFVGDDAENWLKNINLDPQFFWTHYEQILNCQTDDEVISLIKTLRHTFKETQDILYPNAPDTYSASLDDTLFILARPPVGEKYPLKQGQ